MFYFLGLDVLKGRIEENLFKATGRKRIVFRVPAGGKEASWLYKEAAVTNVVACPENSQYLRMTVIITDTCLNKFKHAFIKSK
ncbi:hypothetical protein J437_LFUL001725 [Ladona fulva]|uniref:Uncharacterized protein n=1 Tax=Ladona fulva TaxID=123851 RepID=A0A8K0JZU7_LADFU|nr:hypothetical protein J437_LFUL001725 [Ladona fulva]